jgi:hypothetical protein
MVDHVAQGFLMTHRNLFSFFATMFLTMGAVQAVFAGDVAVDHLMTLRGEHPRLLFTADDLQRIEEQRKTDPLLARLIQQNQVNATQMLAAPSIEYRIPDGKRLLAQSRLCIRRVMSMAMAYRLTGDTQFADAAVKEMLVATEFKDWNPSHFLDTAEMTTALAVGYDWLYDVITPKNRATIRAAIVRLGLDEGMKVYDSRGWWTIRDNNWNQVCNGGMILGALAIAEDEPKLAREVVSRAIASIPRGVSVYAPSGAYPEGPGYWQYGTAYTCLTISGLNTAVGGNFGIENTPGMERTGWYRIHTIGPTGQYFNYADGGAGSRLSSAMFLLADVYDEPAFSWWHRRRLSRDFRPGVALEPRKLDRFFPLEIAWYNAHGSTPSNDQIPLDAKFESLQDIVTTRSRWGDSDAVYVGFKGGDNRANHGHLDVGSFVLDAEGERWALDLGGDNYNLPGYFGGNRWQYYRLINHSHNTLVINGQLQNTAAHCDVVFAHSTPTRASAIVDMTDAYKNQATSARRGIELLNRRAVHVRDEINGAVGQVRWSMVTGAEISLSGHRATLTQEGKTLLAEILAPSDAEFEVLSNAPPTPAEKQNAGTCILAITVLATAEQPTAISVLLQPTDGQRTPLKIEPRGLDQWPN